MPVYAELDAVEWRATSVEKAANTVGNAAAGRWPVERKDGGRRRWSVVEREDDGQSGAVESAAAAWLRWNTPWRCKRDDAVNEEKQRTGLTSGYGWGQ
jgi:hypothetical protein